MSSIDFLWFKLDVLTFFQIKNSRKKSTACCIKNTTNLFTMTLNTLCDAYDDVPYQGNTRPVLRFHRKIAPYKFSFTINNSGIYTT